MNPVVVWFDNALPVLVEKPQQMCCSLLKLIAMFGTLVLSPTTKSSTLWSALRPPAKALRRRDGERDQAAIETTPLEKNSRPLLSVDDLRVGLSVADVDHHD